MSNFTLLDASFITKSPKEDRKKSSDFARQDKFWFGKTRVKIRCYVSLNFRAKSPDFHAVSLLFAVIFFFN